MFDLVAVERDLAFTAVAAFLALLAAVIIAGVLGAVDANGGRRFTTDAAFKLENRAGWRCHF